MYPRDYVDAPSRHHVIDLVDPFPLTTMTLDIFFVPFSLSWTSPSLFFYVGFLLVALAVFDLSPFLVGTIPFFSGLRVLFLFLSPLAGASPS